MKLHVLVVDDAVIVRNRVSKILSTVPEIEAVSVAASGKIALLKIPQVNPDIIILDVEMPEMDGLETLVEIRRQYPKLPVIMFSALTVLGAATTLDALMLGANDYATKPSNLTSIEAANQHILTELVPKIKALSAVETRFIASPASTVSYKNVTNQDAINQDAINRVSTSIDIVAIGVSTGGPNALAEILPKLPADFPAAILIVQHMPPMFTKLMAERLASKCQIPVAEAICGTTVKPGHVWIAPGDYHLLVERDNNTVKLVTNQAPPENSCRPAVDVLFRSVAKVYGNKSLGVVLTGMGKDGLQGAEHIHACGGHIFVQDQASSVVWGMPGFVANAGLAESILPINQMAGAILRLVADN
ncbi:chemotaxis response regulator protein-glutamate methylesterase [Dulcicalothrix desertica PCC 7102]|uniref:Protein-glutamate methylesterase/protein-glutamine glutaminase n=1 Tax=Dulcicalothrix desertica PCC 7102 TaxID=232991 RepID=A0A3S1AHW3_9CYAN|nr:chemotaxis response regulator protein-glutamate methylesterase [Dulcicalothrix desertica]RUT01070.1 chemotaxis response regulator protein-glutamate methylesterase [Dulcicalothrix desertica PCC 7102]TWH39156.1 response regulator receiver-modulated CheB methylesterase [Dulcicalothrix desertica PCC 7102]